ncbi:YncE family protein [Nocardiopsis sp. SBT366]|uniref:YncE family protein n=1 Tax=Nocardiopsis sp. SBT366 TaxID=1580529 RepID=UPI00066D1285|nr:gluconolaconase [Nocardiopsis sp. SBT366]
MGGPTRNNVSTTRLGERFIRHPMTGRNLRELDIAAKAPVILERDREKLRRKAEKKTPDGRDRYVYPTGFSLNKGRFGDFPEREESAHQRGWRAYMTVGVPLVEERGDITQPPPDVVSKQTYVNRTDPTPTTWSHTVEFSISNTISWSLQGQVQLTFGAKATASLQQQLQKSMALNNSQKTTLKNSKDNQGVDTESQSQTTSTTTATGTATGTGELSAQLMLGITASVSGSLTTGFKTSSTLSGEVGSRVDVLATQRRQVRRFDYEFPITFGGWVALYYPEPVEVREVRPDGPQARNPKHSRVLAWKLGETGTDQDAFDLTDDGRPFMQRGEAELVSTLAGEHEVFELENLVFEERRHPLHKDDGVEIPKRAPDEIATGLGRAEGLALDTANRRAYVVERGSGGRLHRVDLDTGVTERVAENLGDTNDVALDPAGDRAYVADYGNRRLLAVSLSDPSATPTAVVQGVHAYGVALAPGDDRAYVSDFAAGKLIEYELDGDSARERRSWTVPRAAGVALHGDRAYVGQFDSGELYEVDLSVEDASPLKVASGLGHSVRVASDGAANAHVCDPAGGRLHEVVLTDGVSKGFQRAVADGLGAVCGVGLDHGDGSVYVSTRDGRLSRIPGLLDDPSAES